MSEDSSKENIPGTNDEVVVTIGLPTYNRPEGLRKCLSHLVEQTYRNLEIIISDNCSSDPGVQEIIHEYTKKDNRIRAFRQPENIGLENNFNFLYAQSTASYFMWMSDDDYFDHDYVENCMAFLKQNPGYVLSSGTAHYYSGNDFLFTEKMFPVDQATPFKRVLKYFSQVGKNGNFYGIFRRDFFMETPVGIHAGCDWSFMARLAVYGKLSYLNTTGYHRSAAGNSATRKRMVRKFKLNWFQTIFFETYLAGQIAGNIFNDAQARKQMPYWKRKLLVIFVFFQINYRLFIHFIKRRILGRKVN